jgi:transcriptional regulator with XRE-family HTH domain
MKLCVFNERLSLRRRELGMEQSDLARAANVTKAAISSYETGRREPRLEVLALLARRLHCTADWLLGADGSPPAPIVETPAWALPLAPDLERIKSRADRSSVKRFVRVIARKGPARA